MVISVCSIKGGVGKSTTAVCLAGYASTHAATLLVDGDANRSVLRTWAASGNLPFPVVDERGSTRHIRHYEHVVTDSAASATRDDLRALADGADALVLPCSPDPLSFAALLATVEILQSLNVSNYRVLLTIVPPFATKAVDELRQTLKAANVPTFRGHIRRYQAHQKAALEGVLVRDVRDEHAADAWADYVAIARELFK